MCMRRPLPPHPRAASWAPTPTSPMLSHPMAPATLLTIASPTYTCDAYGGTAATSGACFAAPDTAGHLWVGMGANALTTGGLWQVSTASGTVTQFTAVNGASTFPFALAIDRNNNLFYSGTQNGANNLFEVPSG